MSFSRKLLLACSAVLSLAASVATAAVSITDLHVTNVGTTTFTAVWTTSEVSTPGLDVFSDSAGTNSVGPALGFNYYPIAEGDPAFVNDALAREARRSLEVLAMNRRVASVRVTGLSPGATYYVRPRTFDANGSDNAASVLPLKAVTTAQFSSMITDARVLQIRIPTFAAEGMVLIVQGPAGTTPLSAIIGDSAAADTALFSTADLLDTTTGTNAFFNSPQPFTIKAIGAGAPTTTFTQIIDFTGGFSAATQERIEAPIDSPAPFFTTHPEDSTVVTGATATFTVAASGTPAPTYQWQRRPAGGSGWSDLTNSAPYSGVTTTTLSVANTTLVMAGDAFRAKATNGVPPDALSEIALLNVVASAVAPSITVQPQPASVVAGVNAAFSVVATGTPAPTYRWQRKPVASDTWSDLTNGLNYSGVTTAELAVLHPTLAMTGDLFRVIVANGVPPDVTSNAVALTVSAASVAPTIVTHPESKSVAVGANETFSVAATGTPTPSYKWQIKLASGSTWLDLGETATYSGTATSSLTILNTTLGMTGDQFRAVASNGTLPDAITEAATLTILAPPTITGQPQPVTVTAGALANFTVIANGTGSLTYQWQRLAAGGAVWQNLINDTTYANVGTAVLKVNAALPLMTGDQFRCIVTDTVGSTTSDPAQLTVNKGVAAIALRNLRQFYDGSARPVAVTTIPAGLNVNVTYNGSSTEPVTPGVYAVSAEIDDAAYTGSATAELVVTTTVIVRHAPTIAGGIDGSVHVVSPEAMTITGWISGDLLVRGTPQVVTTGTPSIGGTRDADGAIQPTNYAVTFSNTAVLSYLVRRVDAVTLPTVAAPPTSAGTRDLNLTKAGQTESDFTTVRNVTVSGTVGLVAIPPGTYGNFTANGAAGLVLGVPGATEPAVYNVQNLSINPLQATARLVVVGPVIINVAKTVAIYGAVGAPEHPEWLTLNSAGGNVSLNARTVFHGDVVAPNSAVTVTGDSLLRGGIIADRLTVTIKAEVEQAAP